MGAGLLPYFNQIGVLGQSGQGPVHVHSRLRVALCLSFLSSGCPPVVNSLKISVLGEGIPIVDTQHDYQALLPHLVLTTQCGGNGSWDTGLSTIM